MHVFSLEAGKTNSEIPISATECTISPYVFKLFTPRVPSCVPRASLVGTLFRFCIFFVLLFSDLASACFFWFCCLLLLAFLIAFSDLHFGFGTSFVLCLGFNVTAAVDNRSTRGQSARLSTHNVLQGNRESEGEVLWYQIAPVDAIILGSFIKHAAVRRIV